MDTKKTCSNCRHFNQLNAEDAECRYQSPRWGGKEKNCFPRISHDAWCGKWAGVPKPPEIVMIEPASVKKKN